MTAQLDVVRPLQVRLEFKRFQRVRDADVILAVNTRLGEISTHGYKLIAAPQPKQALLHIYSDGAELGRVFKASEAIAADPNDFAQAMSHQRAPENPAWGAWARDARADHESFLAAASYPGDLDLGKVEKIAAKIEKGEGTLGKLISDSKVHDDLVKLFDDLERNETLKRLVRGAMEADDAKRDPSGPAGQ